MTSCKPDTSSLEPEPQPADAGVSYALYLTLRCDAPSFPGLCMDANGLEALEIGRSDELRIERSARSLRVGLPDKTLSSQHARIGQESGRWIVEDLKSKNGTTVNGLAQSRALLWDRSILLMGNCFFVWRELQGPALPPEETPLCSSTRELFSLDVRMQLAALSPAIRSPLPLLIQASPGCEVTELARAVHRLSGRMSWTHARCSDLAGDRPWRTSNDGTLFLEEVADLSPVDQRDLLSALQFGSGRIIASTTQPLERTHLLDELAVLLKAVTLNLPPLSKRPEDIGPAVAHCLHEASATLSRQAAAALFHHPWPFNAAELQYALRVAMTLAPSQVIDASHLPATLQTAPEIRAKAVRAGLSAEDEALRARLVSSLKNNKGNISAVARELGKARMQIQRWIKRFRVAPSDYL